MNKISYFRNILIPALMVVFLIVYSCKENTITPDENTGTITGQILDEQEVPVPGAIIQVFSNGSGVQGLFDKDTTDEDGFFELKNIPSDHANLQARIDHEDFAAFDIPLTQITKDKDLKKINVKIQHDSACTGILSLSIVNQSNEPIRDVEIRLNRGDKIVRKSYTDANGNLEFVNVCPGEYWVRVAKYGYRVIEEKFEIEKGDTVNFGFELLGMDDDTCCKGIINFEVKDSVTQQAIKEVKVKLYKGSDKLSEGLTGIDGKYKFERICEGNYQISFMREGYIAQEFNFEVGCNDTLDFSKLMIKAPDKDSCCHGVINFIVKDSVSGLGINNALIYVWKDGKKIADKRTNDAGLAKIEGLCQGKLGFSIQHEQFKGIEFNIELECNDTLELSKYLVKSLEDSCCDGIIEIEVNDAETKEKVQFAKVNLWKGDKLLKTAKTEAGIVRFTDLCIGEYAININHEQYKSIEFTVGLECNKTVKLTKEIVKLSDEKDSCCNGVLIISPKDEETKDLIKGARVKLRIADKVIADKIVENQPLVITNLCEGKYEVVFIAEGYKSAEEDFVLPCNDTLEFPFFMEKVEQEDSCCNGSIKFIVRDKNTNDIIKGATVKLWFGDKMIGQKTSEGESVTFEKLCKGKYSATIIKDGYKGIEFVMDDLSCNENRTVEKTLEKSDQVDCCNGSLIVKPFKDGTDQPINGALVKLWKDDKLITKKYVENGYVKFEKLCKGKYAVDIEAPEYKSIEFSFELGCDENKTIEKGMAPSSSNCCKGVLYVSLKDSTNGNSLENVTVNLWKGNTKVNSLKTGDNGTVTFANVCESENYSFSFSKDGYNSREAGSIKVGCNDTLEFSYKMLKKEAVDTCFTAEISLVVKDKNTEERLDGVRIRVMDKTSGQIIAEGYTNDDGVFNKKDLKAPKAYKFLADIDGYNEGYTVVEWQKCERKEAVLLLQSK